MIRWTLLLAALLPLPAAAQSFGNDSLSGYTIAADILDAPNCDGDAFEQSYADFERALCLFHRPARSPADTREALDRLAVAQRGGLPPVRQQLAALISGIGHCAEAGRHLDAYRASGNDDGLERLMFCRARRLSQAEFAGIRWNLALFDYAEGLPPGRTLADRITEMGQCQAGVLNAALDAECGLITNLSDAEIAAFADDAVDEVVEVYFSGAESPITAMFARKLARAQGLLESAGASIDQLAEGAARVSAEFAAMNGAYEAARDSKIAPIYDAYRESILRAASILDEFERWKGGLFIDEENVNLLPKIVERSADLTGEMQRVEELAFEAKASDLLTDLRAVLNGTEQVRATTAELCRIYYCEIAALRALPDLIRTCRRPSMAAHPLCVEQDGSPRNGTLTVAFEGAEHGIGVAELCVGAGVATEFTRIGLAPAQAALCQSRIP